MIHPFVLNLEVSKLEEWHQIASTIPAKNLRNRELKQSYKINLAKWYAKRYGERSDSKNSLLSEHFLNEPKLKTLRRNEETMVWLMQIVLNDIALSLKFSNRRAYHLFPFLTFLVHSVHILLVSRSPHSDVRGARRRSASGRIQKPSHIFPVFDSRFVVSFHIVLMDAAKSI